MIKKFGRSLAVLALFYLFIVATHGYWLPLAAEFLIVQDPPEKTELIVVSTGSYERFRYAVELMRQDQAEKMLILGDLRLLTPIPGKTILDLAEEEAVFRGVPRENLILERSTSTLADARAAKKVMESRGFKTAGVISDIYNMRRMAMIFDHVFRGASIQLHYRAVDFQKNQFHPDQWWKHSRDFVYVMMEWIKMPLDFYRINFLLN